MKGFCSFYLTGKRGKVLCLLFVFFVSLYSVKAQDRYNFSGNDVIDSLLILIKNDKEDTSKVNHLKKICSEYRSIGLYNTSMRYAEIELQLARQLDFKKGIADSYNNIGVVYRNQGNYFIAISYYFKSLRIAEEQNDKNGIANYLGNIGIIYSLQENYSKALECFFKALKIDEGLGNKNAISKHLGNIGGVYYVQKSYSNALNYFFKALKSAEMLGDKNGMVRHLGNIGGVYSAQNENSKALDYYIKALKIAEELRYKNGIAYDISNIGRLYSKTGKFKEADLYLKRAIAIDESIGALNELSVAEEYLSQLYDTTGRDKLALFHYKKAITLKDTLFSQENKKQIVRKEMNYEFEKKEAITKAENEKQQAIEEEKGRKQKIITWSFACGLLLVLLFAGFIFRSLSITRKQKQIIENKNTETELQKKIIEEKNKDITDSIRYAKRIQDALLKEEENISTHLPDHFILFMPKDIVSGDFYWGIEKPGYWYFAAVDCTGHGVPGAIMSMLGISFLNDIVASEQLLTPAEILNRLRDKVVLELRQTGEAGGSKDGMDISLCRLELPSQENYFHLTSSRRIEGCPKADEVERVHGLRLQWAGANNSLNLFRNGKFEEIKPDKQPIGYHLEQHSFTNHEIQLQKGDSIYIFSDGYADQFGGSNGKKFKYKQLEDLLISNYLLPMKVQKEILKKRFIDWKGSLEQVDDVTIFGIRI